jgi:hypothetical protein
MMWPSVIKGPDVNLTVLPDLSGFGQPHALIVRSVIYSLNDLMFYAYLYKYALEFACGTPDLDFVVQRCHTFGIHFCQV